MHATHRFTSTLHPRELECKFGPCHFFFFSPVDELHHFFPCPLFHLIVAIIFSLA
eukprot:m.229535 g.229535  ORF g.229535 m.229535 type:complete len:55 (-) comp17767_c0_seq1:123-287(-)